ncbi:MAG TPA: cold shock domain-containing protein, partial [Chitinophagaceae bacterium]
KVFKQEDMQIGVPKQEDRENEPTERTGILNFFNEAKGFGFINDQASGERVFVHVNQITEPIYEGDKLTFEVENGPKGLQAINVRKAPK